MRCLLLGLLLSLPLLGRSQAVSRLDSLRRVAAAHPADTAGARAQAGLLAYYLKHDTARARLHGQQALALATTLDDPIARARTEHSLGALAQAQGRALAAIAHYNASARLYRAHGNRRGVSHNERAMGRQYATLGQFPQSMQVLLAALRHSTAAADSVGVAESYAAIGQTHVNMRNYPAAQVAYEQALRRWQCLTSPAGAVDALNHLAIIQRDTRHYAPAAAYLRQGLQQARRDSALTLRLLVTLGVLYQKQERWAESLPPLRRAERLIRQDSSASLLRKADLFAILGLSLVRNGQTEVADRYMHEALTLARRGHAPIEAVDALEGLADVAAARHAYAEAFRYERARGLLQDSLHAVAVARQTTELQVRYEAVEREARNQVQAAQLRAQQQLIRRRNTQLVAGLVVSTLLLGLGYLGYTRYRLRQRLEREQERQQLTQQRTAAVLEAEENERRRIGADLHDGLGQLLTSARLNLHALALELQEAPAVPDSAHRLVHTSTAVVGEAYQEVRGIAHNLMPTALLQHGLAIAVREFLEKLPHQAGLRLEVEVFGLTGRLPDTVEHVLFRVIQELVQNIIRHAGATEVTLQLVQSPQDLTVVVEDNGTGFDLAALGVDKTGMGLRNIHSRVAYLGGEVYWDAAPGRGTVVTLEIPLAQPL